MEAPLLIGSHHASRRVSRREVVPGSTFAGMRELACLCLLLLAFNLPVFLGGVNPFAYDVDAVDAGQWWRVVTHPFTHVSPYHFLLDGIAFVALWAGIAGTVWRRVALTAASAAGALVLSLKEQEFVVAAESIGARNGRIIFTHVLPNCLAPIIVSATLAVGNAIITEAYLSFLGFGVLPPTATWGNILTRAQENIDGLWWMWIFPGFFIVVTVLAINFIGDGLRDAMDPRSTK